MNLKCIVAVMLSCVLGLTGCHARRATERQAPLTVAASSSPRPFYIRDEKSLQAMVDRQQKSAIRTHAWDILRYMLSDDKNPVGNNSPFVARWDSEAWDNKCDLGLGGTVCGKQYADPNSAPCPISAEKPQAQFDPLLQEIIADEAGAPHKKTPIGLLSSVRYNKAAAKFIREHCLHRPIDIWKLSATDDPDDDAVIVKLVWAFPPPAGVPLRVWDKTLDDLPADADPTDWPSRWPFVDINMSKNAPPCGDGYSSYYYPQTQPGRLPSVPLSCFYHREYPCSLLRPYTPRRWGIEGACPSGGTFQAVLMGVHIITAEQRQWVWTTFYWTPDPATYKGYEDQPGELATERGPWRFYAMKTILSADKPAEKNGNPPVAFNPYIETFDDHPNRDNCIKCHQLAAIHELPHQGHPSMSAAKSKSTHFLWSVANNADPSARQSIQTLQ